MPTDLKRLATDSAGTSAIEYALIASLVAIVSAAAIAQIGPQVNAMFLAVLPGL